MNNHLKIIAKNLTDTDQIAKAIVAALETSGGLICLIGDIGAGKTTLVKSVAKYLEIEEKVTSPSFVILNEYHSGKISLYHFDLYRLEKEGVQSIIDELREYTETSDSLAMVEWAEFSFSELPLDRIELKINYIDETERSFSFEGFGKKSKEAIDRIEQNWKNK